MNPLLNEIYLAILKKTPSYSHRGKEYLLTKKDIENVVKGEFGFLKSVIEDSEYNEVRLICLGTFKISSQGMKKRKASNEEQIQLPIKGDSNSSSEDA